MREGEARADENQKTAPLKTKGAAPTRDREADASISSNSPSWYTIEARTKRAAHSAEGRLDPNTKATI